MASILFFAKPPQNGVYRPSDGFLSKIMQQLVTEPTLPPMLYGTNLLKNPEFVLNRKKIAKEDVIDSVPG